MKKERRQHSLNRTFYSDYIGLDDAPGKLHIKGQTISKDLLGILEFSQKLVVVVKMNSFVGC